MYSVITFDQNTGELKGQQASTRSEARDIKRTFKRENPGARTQIYTNLESLPTVR